MPALFQQRCFNHAMREAVGRCTECTRFYCRECVTEHDDRLLCAECVARLFPGESRARRALLPLAQIAELLFGIVIAWSFFYWIGQTLLSIDPAFHEGTIWREKFQPF
jgi:hypothetical protein